MEKENCSILFPVEGVKKKRGRNWRGGLVFFPSPGDKSKEITFFPRCFLRISLSSAQAFGCQVRGGGRRTACNIDWQKRKKDGNKGKIISQEGINRDGLGPGMDK